MNERKRLKQSFEKCELKTIEFLPVESIGGGTYFQARLHCPRTEDERVDISTDRSYSGRGFAVQHLANIACTTVCNSCPFIGKSEVDVTIYRTELAKAEAERLYAYRALEQARADVQKVEDQVLGSPHLNEISQANLSSKDQF